MNPWTLLLNALGSSLSFFYDLIPEYGIAIIMLTLVVSLILFPLTLKQTKSMRAMQKIQPEVKRLQKEYKEDREELNKQLMALYQERGVNPAAGCLPLFVQMPIWFALYRVLWQGEGVPENSELYHVFNEASAALDAGVAITDNVFDHIAFLGMNLFVSPSQAVDFSNVLGSLPYIGLLLLIVAAGYYQQVQMMSQQKSNSSDPLSSQMQSMQKVMRFMPIIFGVISWNFVAGLGLYFATSNLFRIGQQAVILRLSDGDDDGKEPRSDSDPPPEDDTGDSDKSRPSPHASKKRNRRRRK